MSTSQLQVGVAMYQSEPERELASRFRAAIPRLPNSAAQRESGRGEAWWVVAGRGGAAQRGNNALFSGGDFAK